MEIALHTEIVDYTSKYGSVAGKWRLEGWGLNGDAEAL